MRKNSTAAQDSSNCDLWLVVGSRLQCKHRAFMQLMDWIDQVFSEALDESYRTQASLLPQLSQFEIAAFMNSAFARFEHFLSLVTVDRSTCQSSNEPTEPKKLSPGNGGTCAHHSRNGRFLDTKVPVDKRGWSLKK